MTISTEFAVKQLSSFSITVTGDADIAAFKQLIQRGANLWPDAPPEIKEFADLVTTGQVQQNYRAQVGQLIPVKSVNGVLEQLYPVPPFPSTTTHHGV